MTAVSSFWPRVRSELRQHLDPEEFATWIEPLQASGDDADSLTLTAPNPRFLHTLETSYRELLEKTVASLRGTSFGVTLALRPAQSGPRGSAQSTPERRRERLQETERSRKAPGKTLARGTAKTTGNGPGPLAAPLGARGVDTGVDNTELPCRFNPKYTFETFVVGNSNQLAHAAAQAVAQSPSHSYNPLFLYGGVGLGKTHLLHAIGHRILEQSPRLRVAYLPAEQFVNELINSIRFDRMPAFRDRYRNIDVLLIDDIQFIANKERTQEEFFHTFNTLYTTERQIILSSDSSPRKIPTLEERLRSRFEWGLIADIQSPDLETKVAILRRKADAEGIDLPDDMAHFIARQVRSNVRELEGLLTRVTAYASLTANPLTLELAKETLKDILPADDHRATAAEIIKAVARHYGLKVSEIKSRNNSRQIVFPRKVAMTLLRRLTDLSFPEIGKLFNNKHHSTVIAAVKDIEGQRGGDPELDRVLHSLEDHFA